MIGGISWPPVEATASTLAAKCGGKPERAAIFAEPELVAEVAFAEWTEAGTLRHPSYQGLRDDREPGGVVREVPQESPG